MKLIIAGGRDFKDYPLLSYHVECKGIPKEIVGGGARGADFLGEVYAKEWGIPMKIFPADWATYGRGAGPVRNQLMADYADELLAFWDGESRGTKHMIWEMERLGKPVKVVRY